METVEEINKQLLDNYGYFHANLPNWRVVFSDDEREKRFGIFNDFSEDGNIFLRQVEEVREVPKYWHIESKYILERCMPILTNAAKKELLDREFDYYCVWSFEDGNGNALPPKWIACRYIIETVYENAARKVGVKYKNPLHDPKISEEVRRAQLKQIEDTLYGDRTRLQDSLSLKEAVFVSAKENVIGE